MVEDLLLDKEKEEEDFPALEAHKESRKIGFILGSFQMKVKVPGFVVEME